MPERIGLFFVDCRRLHFSGKGLSMLWTIVGIILLLWILGFAFHVAGGLIHLLLVVALVVAVFQLITGRRAV